MGFSGEALVHSLTSHCDWEDLGRGGIQAWMSCCLDLGPLEMKGSGIWLSVTAVCSQNSRATLTVSCHTYFLHWGYMYTCKTNVINSKHFKEDDYWSNVRLKSTYLYVMFFSRTNLGPWNQFCFPKPPLLLNPHVSLAFWVARWQKTD